MITIAHIPQALWALPGAAGDLPAPPTRPARAAAAPWHEATFIGNTPWQWAGLLGVLLASLALGRIAAYFLHQQAERLKSKARMIVLGMLVDCIADPVKLLLLAGGLYVASTFMSLAGTLHTFWLQACKTLAVLAAGWFIFRLVDLVEFYLRRWTSKTDTQLDDQLVPLIRKSLRVFVVIVAVLFIAQNVFAWDVGALIAGLGIGGLAFALAAKDTIANLFGSVTIFADRPFQLGDRVKVGGKDGMIEEVGFRSTRIRTLDGHRVTVPNSIIANETIENVSSRPAIKRVMTLSVTYDTPPEKLQRGVDIIQELLEARKEHFPADYPPRVHFAGFAAASLEISVYYWFSPPDWWAYLDFNHDLQMELLRRFNDEGIAFAFPTQTLYVKQGSPFTAAVREASQP